MVASSIISFAICSKGVVGEYSTVGVSLSLMAPEEEGKPESGESPSARSPSSAHFLPEHLLR